MSYRSLFAHHRGTVLLGFSLSFLSSFGQTFFIALSGPDIRAAFGLSHGGLGGIYSSATLASGLIMVWAGGVLDRVSTRAYAAVGIAGLSLAALGLSAAPNLILLGLSLFALRLFGQGMLSHAAVTSTARLAQGIRGRAVGIATIGFSTGEALLPSVGVALIAAAGYVATWRAVSGALALVLVVGALVATRPRREAAAPVAGPPVPGAPVLRRRDLLRDWRFLVFVPTMVGPPAIVTGYFFHQRLLAERLGWELETLALSVAAYAAAGLLATVAAGVLVDRFRAVRVSRWHLLFLAGASLLLLGASRPVEAPLFFALMGLTSAANGVVVPAVLAELYGTERLGTIRALAGAIMVVGSALTPGVFGLLFDTGVGLGWLGAACATYLAAASAANLLIGTERAASA